MAFYRICPDCGAYLDPGEQCSCHEEHMLKQEKREKQAFLEGWKNNSLFCGAEDVISSESWVRSWIVDHTGDLITNCCNEQVSAIRYLIAEAESLNMSSAETARYIRPTIGLTERQAAANLKYYNGSLRASKWF